MRVQANDGMDRYAISIGPRIQPPFPRSLFRKVCSILGLALDGDVAGDLDQGRQQRVLVLARPDQEQLDRIGAAQLQRVLERLSR